jgi:hypothetical protein
MTAPNSRKPDWLSRLLGQTMQGQLDFVIVKTRQGAVRRYVRLGQRSPDEGVEVISGLAAGGQIIVSAR